MSDDFPALAGFRAGSMLAGYRLEAQVGAGGMAVVFRARDQRLGRLVALKILAPALTADSAFQRRFIAESRAAAAVDDPHIIPVYEAGEAGGVLFIAMRFVIGGDLRRVLDREGPLAPGRAAEFLSPVASALDAAHGAGLVHRDVKPANILVDARPGRPDHVYLSDFGVSKGAVSVSLTGTGQFVGTPEYSAPEQIEGRAVDGRTDQYALACVAYQLLTGATPFERDQGMAVLLAHLSAPPPSLWSRRPGLPAAADQVLARGMAKVPEKRFGSCKDFADALREALGLAPYYPRGAASASGHPQTEIFSPSPGFPGPAADAVPTVTKTAPTPAYSVAGQTGAGPDIGPAAPPGDGEQHATPPRLAHTLTGHTGGWFNHSVNSVAFSPDGQLLASGSSDKRVRLWDPATGEHLRTLTGHTSYVRAVAFSPDGQLLASGSSDKRVRLWDPATGEHRRTLTGHTGYVMTVAFSPDGRLLASGGEGKTVRLWDPATGRHRRTLTALTGDVRAVAFSPDGRLLASGSSDNTVRLWDPATGEHRRTLTGHTGSVSAVAFSPDGRLLATCSWDNTVRLWDPATGEHWRTLTGLTGYVMTVTFSPDGQLLASGGFDNTVRLWDLATGGPWPRLPGHTKRVNCVAFSPNGRLLASCSNDKTVRLWNLPRSA